MYQYRENTLCAQVNTYEGEAVTYNSTSNVPVFANVDKTSHRDQNNSSLVRSAYCLDWNKTTLEKKHPSKEVAPLSSPWKHFAGVICIECERLPRGLMRFQCKHTWRSAAHPHSTFWRLTSSYMYLYMLTPAFRHSGDCSTLVVNEKHKIKIKREYPVRINANIRTPYGERRWHPAPTEGFRVAFSLSPLSWVKLPNWHSPMPRGLQTWSVSSLALCR